MFAGRLWTEDLYRNLVLRLMKEQAMEDGSSSSGAELLIEGFTFNLSQ